MFITAQIINQEAAIWTAKVHVFLFLGSTAVFAVLLISLVTRRHSLFTVSNPMSIQDVCPLYLFLLSLPVMAAYGAHGASDLMKKYSVYFPHKLGDVFKGLRYVRPLVGTIRYNQRLAVRWLTWRYVMLEHCARFNIPWPSLETLLPYAKYAGYAAGSVVGFYLLYILHRKLPLIFYFFRAIWTTYLDEGFVAVITHLLVLGRAHCRRVKRAASLR